MWIHTLSFVAGSWLCLQHTELPPLYIILLLLPTGGLCLALHRYTRLSPFCAMVFFLMAGYLLTLWHAVQLTDRRLHKELVGQDILVSGFIAGLPRQSGADSAFDFFIEEALWQDRPVNLPQKIRLTWYRASVRPVSGQKGQFVVRLKPPTATLNEGLFDREAWFFRQQTGARGYVRKMLTLQDSGWDCLSCALDRWRQLIALSLDRFGRNESLAILKAISVGDRSDFDDELWQIMQRNGVNHLVAISGLHVSIIAGLFYLLSGHFWRSSARLCRLLPAVRFQALSAMAGAAGYAALAGFSVPTQRALIMLLVIFAGRLLYKNPSVASQVQWALLAILLWDPLALMDSGFWLSFLAVAGLILSTRGYLRLGIIRLLHSQFAVTLFLLPLTLLFFGQVSLVSLLVNLLAIPLFSLFFIPLGLLSVLLSLWPSVWSEMLVQGYLWLLQQVIEGLRLSADLSWSSLSFAGDRKAWFVLGLLPVLVWFLPMPLFRWAALAGCLLLIPLFKPVSEDEQLMRITLLDVGQGLSMLLTQSGHAMLYDLGPRYQSGGSATRQIVMPYLQYRGISGLDALVISHSDADHAGDFERLLKSVPVGRLYAGEPWQGLQERNAKRCAFPVHWRWQTTVFEFLNPESSYAGNNNNSCVLKISRGRFSLLLTGDIEKTVERWLVAAHPEKLASTMVVIPHHGSRSSSGQAFVDAVQAEWVLNASGFLNRYHFPHQHVKQRWLDSAGQFLDTARHGAIDLWIDEQGQVVRWQQQSQQQRRFWRWPRE